jgi:glycolate oxidase iron-sulfur subunit
MAGYTVAVPERQTCCGALPAHDGKAEAAERYQRQNNDAFGGYDIVVATAAGCSAHLADYRWDGHEPETIDVTVAVARAIEDGRLPRSEGDRGPIAIQDPCHLRHVQRVDSTVRTLLDHVADVVELDDDGLCCGAGGAYSALEPELAGQIRERKVAAIDRALASAGPIDVLASANPGCSMHLGAVLADRSVPVEHPVDIVAGAIRDGG